MTLDKILSKALSTSSEDEAIAALLIARKKYNGGQISLNKEVDHWKEIARKSHEAAKQERYFRKKYFSELSIMRLNMLKQKLDHCAEIREYKNELNILGIHKKLNLALGVVLTLVSIAAILF
jgi:hypothetical protein